MPQTSVANAPSVAVAGMIATEYGAAESPLLTRTSEETVATSQFGTAVAEGASVDGFLNLAANDDRPIGVIAFNQSYANPQQIDDNSKLQPGTTVGLMYVGPVWVQIEGTITQADDVHVRAVATGSEVAGAFRAAKDGTDTIDLSGAGFRWMSGNQSGLALLWVNFPAIALATADS